MRLRVERIASILAAVTLLPDAAFAHSAGRGFVLLLPTAHVIAGGTLAVIVSFLIVALIPDKAFLGFFAKSRCLGRVAMPSPTVTSTISAVFVGLLIWTGFSGPRDPLENLLPLTIWTVWWVGIVLIHPILGNAWAWLNPFAGPHALLFRSLHPPLSFPLRLSYMPAILIFFGFAWFQLVYPSPQDPETLAMVVLFYVALTSIAVFVFGSKGWLYRADPFAVFLYFLSLFSPFSRDTANDFKLTVGIPGARLAESAPLPMAGILFILLTLSSVSFDALSNTFWWLSLGGVNPLDFPGRTAVEGLNSGGLALSFLLLTILFVSMVSAGWTLAGRPVPLPAILGRLVFALIPVSIAFHFAHYLVDLLVNGQYMLLAINDPFELGWHLLGLEQLDVTTSFLNTASGAKAIFAAQTAAIILGHIVGVAVAHLIIVREGLPKRTGQLLETPVTMLMIAYTAFGLWTLAAPAIA